MNRSVAALLAFSATCQEYTPLTDLREQPVTEVFEISGALTDVVFFADNSHSMQRDLIMMGSAFEHFIARLDAADDDWHVIAITGPDGCATSGIITPDTADHLQKFATGIQTPPDDDDVDEWGLFNVERAVLNSVPGRCNAGFMRDDAILHVIFLSDEPDHSPGYELGGSYWQDYVDTIGYAKGDASKVRFSAIVGPPPSGCDGAEVGTGYVEAAQSSGGEVISICSDWGDQVEILADASVEQSVFPLAHEPLPETLRVQLNSEDASGWHYDTAQQSIVFTENIPRGEDEVIVSYRAYVEVVIGEEE